MKASSHSNRRKGIIVFIAATGVVIVTLAIAYWPNLPRPVVLAPVKDTVSLFTFTRPSDTILLRKPAVSTGHAVRLANKPRVLHKTILHIPVDSAVVAQNEECTTPQIQAKFPGGDGEWRKYLERNTNRDLPVENGAPPGNYTIVVSFLVDIDGSISDVRAENNPGYGVAEEYVRIIKAGPKWIPALKDGKPVKYRQRQYFCIYLAEE